VDLETGKRVAYFEFLSGVEEIFDVRVLPTSKNPYISGPLAAAEGAKTIWYAPAPRWLHPQQAAPDQDSPIATVTSTGTTLCKEAFDVFQQGVQQIREDQFVEALESFDQALQLEAKFPQALCNRGLVQQLMRQFDESIVSFQQSLELAPEEASTHMNLSMTLFLQQNLAEAWHEYQWRWQSERFESYPADIRRLAPQWDGTSLKGKRILVFGEQGIGDEIMFASCLPEVIDAAESCLIACSPRLIPMFRRSFPAAEVISRYQLPDVGELDWQVGAGTVARYLRREAADFPRQEQFLSAEAELIDHWRGRLSGLGPGKKIGISWEGGKELDDRRRRSTSLEQWLPVLATDNVQFVNLQYGDCHDELAELQQQHGITIHDYAEIDPLTDMDGLAALVASLDLVISIDNTTIHLSGALGIPTWALLSFPSMSYWRWFLPGEETVWYRSLELFRREHPDGWEATFDQVAKRLGELN
jgi:tetratricopeptide (TPR) repeat protein